MRIALGIEYDGSAYAGWQRQPHASSVQQVVEEAISCVANQSTEVVCAGRTDTGVHAVGQVVHFDTNAERSERSWVLGGNANLPKDVNISWAQSVDDRFHARFAALSRSYRYVILNRTIRSAIYRQRACCHFAPLDAARMSAAAQYFVGEYDFTSFRASACQAKSPVRTIQQLDVARHDNFIVIDIRANAFLHHMVRNIAGTLMVIGEGEQDPEWVQSVLSACDRRVAAVTAPAQGLYLVNVEYPPEYKLPTALPPQF